MQFIRQKIVGGRLVHSSKRNHSKRLKIFVRKLEPIFPWTLAVHEITLFKINGSIMHIRNSLDRFSISIFRRTNIQTRRHNGFLTKSRDRFNCFLTHTEQRCACRFQRFFKLRLRTIPDCRTRRIKSYFVSRFPKPLQRPSQQHGHVIPKRTRIKMCLIKNNCLEPSSRKDVIITTSKHHVFKHRIIGDEDVRRAVLDLLARTTIVQPLPTVWSFLPRLKIPRDSCLLC